MSGFATNGMPLLCPCTGLGDSPGHRTPVPSNQQLHGAALQGHGKSRSGQLRSPLPGEHRFSVPKLGRCIGKEQHEHARVRSDEPGKAVLAVRGSLVPKYGKPARAAALRSGMATRPSLAPQRD
jgi:hypothetical protein